MHDVSIEASLAQDLDVAVDDAHSADWLHGIVGDVENPAHLLILAKRRRNLTGIPTIQYCCRRQCNDQTSSLPWPDPFDIDRQPQDAELPAAELFYRSLGMKGKRRMARIDAALEVKLWWRAAVAGFEVRSPPDRVRGRL